jgi:hypothetical protein
MQPITFNQERTFGVEIEAYNLLIPIVVGALNLEGIECTSGSYNHTTQQGWKVVTDSSLQGRNTFEVVSPPLKGEAGLQEVAKVLKILKAHGAKVNDSCGFHVHWNAADFNGSQLCNVLGLYAKFEAVIDFFVTPSRRNNMFCLSTRKMGNIQWIAELTGSAYDVAYKFSGERNTRNSTRYCKVNLNAYLNYGTVEFRQHQGTLNSVVALHWIMLTHALMERAKISRLGMNETAKLTIGEFFRVLGVYDCQTEEPKFRTLRKFFLGQYKKFKGGNDVTT